MKILLVEDDPATAALLVKALTAHHYTVNPVADGQEGLDLALAFDYDLILLDLLIPKLDGISFCQQLRSQGKQTPVLLLTGRDSVADRVRGLEAGADDYVTKPFDLTELIARIRALLRRSQSIVSAELTWEDLHLNTNTHEARYGETLLRLTPKEYGILELFLRHPQRIFSRSTILDKLWDFADLPGEETVTSHIRALRQKLKAAGAHQDLIETVYGLGYRLKSVAAAEAESIPTPSVTVEAPAAPVTEEKAAVLLSKFWERFKDTYLSQVEVLEQAIQALVQGQFTPELRQQSHQECHKLAGSLGMYGYHNGSTLARQLEGLLQPKAPPLSPADITQVSMLVQQLRQELEQPPTFSLAPVTAIQFVSVLVIDDDATLVEHLKIEMERLSQQESLASRSFRVTGAADPRAARGAIAQNLPDIVLLDLTFADTTQDGLTLLQELGSRFPDLPILVFTGCNSLTERIEVARLGARAFLQKPVSPDRILQIINQILDQNHLSEGKVLIVDDDPLILASVKNMLEPWGLRVQTLKDPQKFLDILNSFVPDLLVLDVEMPTFSGIELCQVVRNDLEWGDIPILFLTAHTEVELIYQAFAAGGDDYIRKPIVEPELITRIISRLDRMHLLQTSRLL